MKYPDEFDGNDNLFEVHDALRVILLEDYLPGQKEIVVEGDTSRFPSIGLITLTEQQSDIDERAISFLYGSKTENGFAGLELLPNFTDVPKSKLITHVTQNVMAEHHNNLKDAIIAVEDFVGIKGTIDSMPLGSTMEGRTNFLRKLVLRPRAWFTANKRIGIVPLMIKFSDLSFRNPTSWCWNFGDQSISTSSCSVLSTSVISTPSSLIISNTDHSVQKTYFCPGIYDVTLTVGNSFGEDTLTAHNFIIARVAAPEPATINFIPNDANQELIGDVLRTRTNSLVEVEITSDGSQPEDPIITFKWNLQDDLTHSNASTATASYSVGGFYDIRLRTETYLGAYRTTIFSDIVDVIEKRNLWFMIFPDTSTNVTKNALSYEFGLISETFKIVSRTSQTITRDYTIVNSPPEADRKVKEYLRNNGFVPKNVVGSGDKGNALVYWTEGDSPILVRFKEYNGFSDVWATPVGLDTIERGWNWIGLNASSKVYFLLGSPSLLPPNTPGNSPTNQNLTTINLSNYAVSTSTFSLSSYKNSAEELRQNVGLGVQGDFSVYRSCFRNNTGFIVRNDGVGSFFRLKSFYRTEGTLANEIQFIRKLTDLPGSVKLEGQLVPLSGGIYFFDNSGEVVVWNNTTETWAVGAPSANSSPFRELQDPTVSGFNETTNRLTVTSDGNRLGYLSFDYSNKTFIKFNEATITFSLLSSRPAGEQFLMGIY